MKSDFYVILPSNSCPLTQPDNKAGSFIVDWQTPINLAGDWEVALTEFSFNYFHSQVASPSKLTYKGVMNAYSKFNWEYNSKSEVVSKRIYSNYSGNTVRVRLNKQKYVELSSPTIPYTLIFENIFDAKAFGFTKLINPIVYKEDTSPNVITGELISKANVKTVYDVQIPYDFEHVFTDYMTFEKPEDIVAYILERCGNLFYNFGLTDTGYITFSLNTEVTEIKFEKQMMEALGLTQDTFLRNDGRVYIAENKPYKDRPFNQLYLYSSCIDPILVGGVKVPLLRTIWVESKYKIGDVINEIIERPMYLPVAMFSINKIEIEIRDDSGKLINFPFGSKSNLTLHFRKNE